MQKGSWITRPPYVYSPNDKRFAATYVRHGILLKASILALDLNAARIRIRRHLGQVEDLVIKESLIPTA